MEIEGADRTDGTEGRVVVPESRIPDWDTMALVGRIARPHGLRGEVVINPETDFVDERYARGASLWTRSATGDERLTIASSRVHNGRPIVLFDGFGRIEDVERLAGLELRVPEDSLRRLPPGMYYEYQLVGCAVETLSGERVGEVAKVEGGAGASRLVMNGPHGEILIPLAVDICVDVDIEKRRIRIDAPQGLLDLNETKRGRQPRR